MSEKTGKKRLLMGITLSETGGSQKVVFDIISSLPEDEFEVTLVTSPDGELIKWINELNIYKRKTIAVITLSSLKRDISPVCDMKAFIQLIKIIFIGKFDIAHFHNSKIGVLGRTAAWVVRVPKIYYTVHGWGLNASKSPAQYKVLVFLEKLASRLSTKIICVSVNDMEKGIKEKWFKAEKACVIHNGLDESVMNNKDLRKSLDISEDIPILATVMRLSKPKDPVFTIKVAVCLKMMGYKYRLLIIGDGPLREPCEALIEETELAGQVTLMGFQENARSMLKDIDIYLLFSQWEGLPISIIEAMLAAKPVVASNVGGISELVKHSENGFLLDGFDVNEAAQLIKALLDDRGLRASLGEKGFKIARDEFLLNRMMEKYLSLYRE